MKRITILFTIMALMLTGMTFHIPVYAQETQQSETYTDEIETMEALGLYTDMPSNPVSGVSRALFVSKVIELIGAKGEFKENQSPFYDVKSTDKYYAQIVLAAQLGIIHGDDSRNFRPNDNITYIEGTAIILNALNYYSEYPYGYLQTAAQLDITKGISLKQDDMLRACDCAKMLLNAGNVVPYKNDDDSDNRWYINGEETVFWSVHRIAKAVGIVRANEYSSLDSASGIGKDRMILGDKLYTVYNSSMAYDYLGHNVEAYYKMTDNDAIILHLKDRNTEIKVIKAKDISGVDGDVISYYTNERPKNISVPKNASVLYNGKLTLQYAFDDGTSIFMPKTGTVTFIDNNHDGKYEVISVTSCHNAVVSGVDADSKVIYNLYYPNKMLDMSNVQQSGSAWSLVDTKGRSVDISKIEKYDVITYAESMDGEVVRGILTKEEVSGVVKSVEKRDGNTHMVINGKDYELDCEFENASENIPRVNDEVTVVLDSEGRIAGMKTMKTDKAQYGFYIKSVALDETDGERFKVKIMDTVGKGGVMEYETADKVKIDGVSYDNKKYTGTENRNLHDYMTVQEGYVRTKQNIQNNNVGFLEPFQVVLFKLDSDGRISYIDTQRKRDGYENEYTLTKISPDKDKFKYNGTGRYFYFSDAENYSIVGIGENTKLLATPLYSDIDNYMAYRYMKYNEHEEAKWDNNYNLEAYTTDPKALIPEVIHFTLNYRTEVSRISTTALVKEISEGLTSDGEASYRVNYFSDKNEYTYYANPALDLSWVKAGDLLKIEINSSNEIIAAKKVIDYDYENNELKFCSTDFKTISDIGNKSQHYIGYNYAFDDNLFLMMKSAGKTGAGDIDYIPAFRTFEKIYKVEKTRKGMEVKEISFEEAKTIHNYRDHMATTPVFVRYGQGVTRMIIVYDVQ